MDIEIPSSNEKLLKLYENLQEVEHNRLRGSMGFTIDELDSYLESILD